MIVSFKNPATKDIFNGKESAAARKVCRQEIWRIAQRKLEKLDSVKYIDDLKIPRGNRLESLRGDRKGSYSIRVNDQYRVCFRWGELGPEEVEIVNYH